MRYLSCSELHHVVSSISVVLVITTVLSMIVVASYFVIPISAPITTPNTPATPQYFGPPYLDPNRDADGDGLLNGWEERGIDVNNDGRIDLNLPALGATYRHKDIFVEIDYMQYHRPNQQAINEVKNAFARAPVSNNDRTTGISLHIDVGEQFPHRDSLQIWTDVDSKKGTYFGTPAERSNPNYANIIAAKKLVYHYGLFIHTQYGDPGTSGIAELPGDDFVVSLGSGWARDSRGHSIGSIDQQAGTLMHELGHNLNLRHGGNVNENCKPNYLSVMSYTRQFKNLIGARPLDYSRSTLERLQEGRLTEYNGISISLPPRLFSVMGTNPVPVPTGRIPIDFNNDGSISPTSIIIRANINNFPRIVGCNYSSNFSTLAGYNDWANLLYNIRNTAGFNNAAPSRGVAQSPSLLLQASGLQASEEMTSGTYKEFHILQIEALDNATQKAEFKDPVLAVQQKKELKNDFAAVIALIKSDRMDEANVKLAESIKPKIDRYLSDQGKRQIFPLIDNSILSLNSATNKTVATSSPTQDNDGTATAVTTLTFNTPTDISGNIGGSEFPKIITAGSANNKNNNVSYVVWQDDTLGNYDVFLSKRTDGVGSSSFSEQVNISHNIFNSTGPSIAASGSNVYVVWSDDMFPTEGSEIFFSKSTDGGSSFSDPVNISNNFKSSQFPAISISDDNTVYVVWQDFTPENFEIFFSKSTDDGGSFSDPVNISNSDGFSENPQLEVANDNVYVVWQDEVGDGIKQAATTKTVNHEIFFSKSADGGSSFSDPVNISNNHDLESTNPNISLSYNNNVYVVWEDFLSSSAKNELSFAKSTDGGSSFSDKTVITNTGDNSIQGSLRPSITAYKNVYIVWGHNSTNNFETYLTKSTDGGASFGGKVSNLSSNDGLSGVPSIALSDDNTVNVVWQDDTPGNFDIFFTTSNNNKN